MSISCKLTDLGVFEGHLFVDRYTKNVSGLDLHSTIPLNKGSTVRTGATDPSYRVDPQWIVRYSAYSSSKIVEASKMATHGALIQNKQKHMQLDTHANQSAAFKKEPITNDLSYSWRISSAL